MVLRLIAYDYGELLGMNVMNSAVTKEQDEWREFHEELIKIYSEECGVLFQ